MKVETLLFSLVALLFSFLLIALGFFLILIPFARDLKSALLAWISQDMWMLAWIGAALGLIGLLLIVAFFGLCRRRYLLIKMGKQGKITLDPSVLENEALIIFQKFFPNQPVHCEARISRKQRIEFIVDFPMLDPENREKVLEEIESALQKTLEKRFGYQKEFILNVSFGKKP